MPRLTRAESRQETRDRIMTAAKALFARHGYAATSIERIAAAADFTKGAVYSNFANKEAIFRAVLQAQGDESLDAVVAQIAAARTDDALIAALVAWADHCSGSGSWSLTILEYGRIADGPKAAALQTVLRGHWQRLGSAVLACRPGIADDAETLGTLLHELAYAPAMTLVARPTAGGLMRLAMTALLAGTLHPATRTAVASHTP